jgi:hypothetical protein
MKQGINALEVLDRIKAQQREDRDRKISADWHRFEKEWDRDKIWGPCGGQMIYWDDTDRVMSGPLEHLFNLDVLSNLLTDMCESGLWDEETLRCVYDRAAMTNEILKERDMREYAPEDRWEWEDTAHEDH